MDAKRDWLAEIDGAEQMQPLQAVLADLHAAIDELEHSVYAEEASVREQLRTLELLADYCEQKLVRVLA